ncbi:MAG TPA: NusA-like transcription termination signal-binding factor [Candidatus Thermoplasmatota archaeon]|nr:NusA-like transcription termination signal-binding factor [Candidatus Thermoplasmatota archaeon]
MEIKLDADTLRLFTLFERVTRARLKDLMDEPDRVIFVVDEGFVGKAVGKGAVNLKRLREMLNKEVEIFGYAADKKQFIENLFHRHKLEEVTFEQRSGVEVARVKVDPAAKGKVIGKGGRNVQLARLLADRHHGVRDIIVE